MKNSNIKHFSELTEAEKRQIALVFRAHLLNHNISWASIVYHPEISPSNTKFGLPEEAILEFMKICEKKGLRLSKVEATKEAHNLINLYKTLTYK